MARKSGSARRRIGRSVRHEAPRPQTFAEAWSVLRSSSSSRGQKSRLLQLLSSTLLVFLAATVSVTGSGV